MATKGKRHRGGGLQRAAQNGPAALLAALVAFDTTNPPGNETPLAAAIAKLLQSYGAQPVLLEPQPGRGSVVCRIKATGTSASKGLLLMSHIDVVPAKAEEWSVPPFSGVARDGFLYGRGTFDDKYLTATHLTAVIQTLRSSRPLRRDLIFAATADEEAGGGLGMDWIARNHFPLIDCDAGLNEGGGFSLELDKRNVYLLQAAERGSIWLELIARGEPGHASMPRKDAAVDRLLAALGELQFTPALPHLTRTGGQFLAGMLPGLNYPRLAAQLVSSAASGSSLARLFPTDKDQPAPGQSNIEIVKRMFFNSMAITGLEAGDKINVVPSRARATLDIRVLPGIDPEQVVKRVQRICRKHNVEVGTIRSVPGVQAELEHTLLPAISQTMRELDPLSQVVPYMLPASTDARFLIERGIPIYGFAPVMPRKQVTDLTSRAHGIDERISLDDIELAANFARRIVELLCC